VEDKIEDGAKGGAVLDSVKNDAEVSMPKTLATLMGEVSQNHQEKILDSVMRGLEVYRREHGVFPTADVVEASVQQGLVALRGLREDGTILDSATSGHHDQGSLQPNRAVVSILSGISEAIPVAGYLPVDIGSNEGRLAIVSHIAGSTFGDYVQGALLDGVAGGGVFSSAQRMVQFTTTGAAPYTSTFTQTNLVSNPGYCDPAGTPMALLRGRTIVYVNGIPAAQDSPIGSGTTSALSGSITMPNGTTLTIAGTVNLTTGVIAITAPASLTGYEVTAQAFIDFEASPALIPKVQLGATVYPIFANPSRVMTGITIDAAGQFRNELGLDGMSEALLGVRNQQAQERHYQVLRYAYRLGANNIQTYAFNITAQGQYKVRAQIWQDFAALLGQVSQDMANATMDHGVTHLYVTAFVAAQLPSLPPELFEPSGISARPGIYRLGRLFGQYEVYYTPKVIAQSVNLQTAEILAIGRSNQPGRCPIIIGDAVAPTFLDLNMQTDLIKNAAVYSRDFTVVNPHMASALGAARINVTGLSF
jgi:hypothetical protein